jgi:hypothetical protein
LTFASSAVGVKSQVPATFAGAALEIVTFEFADALAGTTSHANSASPARVRTLLPAT